MSDAIRPDDGGGSGGKNEGQGQPTKTPLSPGTSAISQGGQPTTKSGQYDPNNTRRDPIWHRVSVIGTFAFSGALVIVGALQFGVYSRQAKIMAAQNEIAGKQAAIMQAQNSAVVTYSRITSFTEGTRVGERAIVMWTVLKNTGGALARVSFDWTNFYQTPVQIAENYDFHNLPGSPSRRYPLAPQAERESVAHRMTESFFNQVRDHAQHLYIYGTTVYADRYKPDHVSMYCLELLEVGPWGADGGALAAFAPCEHHNCVDDDCKDEPRAGMQPHRSS